MRVFRDSEAVAAHMENVRDLLSPLLEIATFQRIVVLGNLTEEGYSRSARSHAGTIV